MRYILQLAGPAGSGVKSAGLIFAKLAARSGYHVFCHTEYPSLIRGGRNTWRVVISDVPVHAPSLQTDLLIDLDKKVAADIPFPDGEDINVIALGMAAALTGADPEILKPLIKEAYNSDPAGAQTGYECVVQNHPTKIQKILPKREGPEKIVIDGNDGVALGAIAGGLQFAAIYPMSPISPILATLAAHQQEFGYVYKQPEDEISAITMVIGASFAGVRAMTVTSGGGFCLMTEGLGLAAMTETPIVIVNGMRPGPATGLPSWSAQGDLQFALHAHQDELPRIVLAAADAKDAFNLTMAAFNLADKYQLPVIVLIDKNICDGAKSYENLEEANLEFDRGKFTTVVISDYKRYEDSPDGVSPRTVPGTGNYFLANSDEHDEFGYSTEGAEVRSLQMQKRMRKLAAIAKNEMPAPELTGPENADLTIVSWGSNKGAILEAMTKLQNVNYLHLTWLCPFPAEAVKNILSKSKKILGVEANFSGQACDLIREKTGIEITIRLCKYDGRPIYPEEIADKIKEVISD